MVTCLAIAGNFSGRGWQHLWHKWQHCMAAFMKGNVIRLVDVIDGKNKILEIPVYQRNYDWKRENISKLIQDLVEVEKEGRPSHFFGSIVTQTDDGHQVVVIDGQQRLTSVTLLLLALRQRFLEADNQSRADEIYETYLYNKFSDENDHYKLRPIKRDLEHYKKLFLPVENFARPSNMTTNYEFFYNIIETLPLSCDELLDAIEKLEVMHLSLQNDDDPQLIFESINSTGLDLTDADKVRNLLLMNESHDRQIEYFERYWHPIEQKSHYDVTPLIRYWLTNRLGRVPVNSRLYFEFKDYIGRYEDKRVLLDELLMYANNYQMLIDCETGDSDVDRILERDQRLAVSVETPFYLAILADVRNDELEFSDFAGAVQLMENYLFRRTIAELPTNGLNKLFATLHRDVMRRLRPEFTYAEVLTAVLLNKRESGRFPQDEEFIEKLTTRDVYHIKSGVRGFLFERLENWQNKEAVDVFSGLDDKQLSIEHIMPQHLTAQWRNNLGSDFQEIHTTLLNRLGNLTLTGYNSEMQNVTFDKKQEFYRNSHLGLTRSIAEYSAWGRT